MYSLRNILINVLKTSSCNECIWMSNRFVTTANPDILYNTNLTNRNPRNLERIRISRKPTGYHLDKPGKTFWHKVSIIQKPRYAVATVSHNNGNVVIQASTNEWAISKHLHRSNDLNAYINLARVLAERCMQSGINEMINGVDCTSNKRKEFVKHFEEAGIVLNELPTYQPLTPWNRTVDQKPWEVHVDGK